MKQSMSVLVSSLSDEWASPPFIIDMVREVFGGEIEIDPAAAPDPNFWIAKVNYTKADDGLKQQWNGKTYLNPPYSAMPKWADYLVKQWESGVMPEAIALLKTYQGYAWYKKVMNASIAFSLPFDRLTFIPMANQQVVSDGKAKFGSTVFYFGPRPKRFKEVFDRVGWTFIR